MGIRFALLLFALIAIWLILKFFVRTQKNLNSPKQQKKIKTDRMVACHYCGLHVPEKEAVIKGNYYYCCQEHSEKEHDNHKP